MEALPGAGFKRSGNNANEWRKVEDLPLAGEMRPFLVRVLITGRRVKYQVRSGSLWRTRSNCMLADVDVGKGYTRIGPEFIYH